MKKKFICRNCGKIFDVETTNSKGEKIPSGIFKCDRCGSKDFVPKSHLKQYYKCKKCNHCFKVSFIVAKNLFIKKEKPQCTVCPSESLLIITKREYLINSGNLKKKYNTIEKKLF